MPDARLRVFVVWAPLLQYDSRTRASEASGYLPDSRARHFWDLWNFSTRLYTSQLRFPPEEMAWDVFVLYKPHLVWREAPPEPTAWMQNRGLDHGPPYSKERLAEEFGKWIQ
jgi:hypothetical protein